MGERRTVSRRARERERQPVRSDTTIREWPEAGLVLTGGPADPPAGVRVESGRIVEIDGRSEDEFDSLDRFIARHTLDPAVAEEAMALSPLELARRLFHPDVEASEVRRLFSGLTPARLVEVVGELDVLEMMQALRKMANQAHVTNLRDHPALLAADAAEAARRGFAEVETTVGVAGMAPLNAIAVLIGSQVGRPGVLTQAAVEEGVNLRLAMKGLVSYAETLSVYGNEESFKDGDDTPWSKAFLAAAYASRGVKVRFTSGSGSEVLLGHAAGHSMLYLEARCILLVKGAASVGLEVASGNDAMSTHSEMRKTAKLMLQMLPGTDFVTSGYSVMPRQDNLFGGGNFDSNDLDAWTAIQRDLGIDGGITPVDEDEIRRVRKRATEALQATWAEMGFPAISDEEVDAAVNARDSGDLPPRAQSKDAAAARRFLESPATVLDLARALQRRGFGPEAEALVSITRQRAAGDYLQPSGILVEDGADLVAVSAVDDPHRYRGPGTGYRVGAERRRELESVPFALDPRTLGRREEGVDLFNEGEAASPGHETEVVMALGPAFGSRLGRTLGDLSHRDVVEAILAGLREEQVPARLVRVRDTADCAFIGHQGARLSGSGVAIGIQSRGTAVIHQRDLAPLDNLELLSHAPNLTLDSYRSLGRNAARYALDKTTEPVTVRVDNTARLKYIVQSTLWHRVEVEAVELGSPPVEVTLACPGTGAGSSGEEEGA